MIRFSRQSDPDTSVGYTIEGTYDAAGTTEIEGSGGIANVVIASGADPLTIGRLDLNSSGELTAGTDITVEDRMDLNNASARFESDQAITVNGMLTWQGGTVAGSGTTRAGGGLSLPGGAGSASNNKRLDGHRLVLTSGVTGSYPGAKLSGGNGAVLEIEDGAVFNVQTPTNITVFSGSTARPTVINRGTLRKTGTENRTTLEWALDNSGTVAVDFGTSGSDTEGLTTSSSEGDMQTSNHLNTPDDLNLQGPLTDQGGTYRAVRNGQLSFRQQIDAVMFGEGSMIEADSSGTISFGRQGRVDNQDTSVVYTVEGTYDVEGTTELDGSNAADVTLTDRADVQTVGGAAVDIGANNGVLRTEFAEPFSVGSLTIGRNSRLLVQSDLTVEGPMKLDGGGRFESGHALVVKGTYRWRGGQMRGTGITTIQGGMQIERGGFLSERRLILAEGITAQHTGGFVEGQNGAVIEVRKDATLDLYGFNWLVTSEESEAPTLLNGGTVRMREGARTKFRWPFENRGSLVVGADRHLRLEAPLTDAAGTYRIEEPGGRLDLWPDTTGVTLSRKSSLAVETEAQFTYESDSSLTTRGTVETQGDFYTERPLRVDGGTVMVSDPGTLIRGTLGSVPSDPDAALHLTGGGELHGTGFVTGDVASDSGTVRPGGPDATGVLNVQGDYTQRSGTTLDLELGGTSAGDQHDRLDVEGAELGGTLRLALVDGYEPGEDDLLRPMRWSGERLGLFDAVDQDTGGSRLALEYDGEGLRVFDGSLPVAPSAPDVSVRVEAPSFTRADSPAPVGISVTSAADRTVGQLETENIDVGISSSPAGECPQDDAYENLKCRLAPYGVVPPEPPEGESYPFLVQVSLSNAFSASTSSERRTAFSKGTDSAVESAPSSSGPVSKATTRGKFLSFNGSYGLGGAASCPNAGENLQTGAEVPGPIMTNESLDRCAQEVVDDVLETAIGVIPGSGCIDLADKFFWSGFQDDADLAGAMAGATFNAIDCATDFVGATKAIEVMEELNSKIRDAQDFDNCFASGGGGGSGGAQTTCVAAIDPNDKRGPEGVGAERYTAQTDSLPYTVFFENKPEATAPAQEVTITDTLGTDRLDASAFSFGPIQVADTLITVPRDTTAFEKEVSLPERDLLLRIEGSLDETSGLLRWTFASLDPETRDPVTDPLAGFLPPNDEPPEGEGSVSYFPTFEGEVESGTRFGGAAEIVFDDNDPIDTSVWTNVLDLASPESAVEPLAGTQEGPSFEVHWDGTDTESGVRHFTIYVSEDGGSFEPWLEATRDTTATFEGRPGGEYAFYSVARDSVGNSEVRPSAPDVTTSVSDELSVQVARSFGGAAGPSDYRLVALPGQVDRPLAETVQGEAGVDWQAVWDDGSEEDFWVRYDQDRSDRFSFRPGRGLWLTALEDWAFEDTLPTVDLVGDTAATIGVRDGWNIVSNPLGQDVSWSAVEQANGGGLQPAWAFEGSFRRADTFRTAATGRAYYFFNDAGLDSLTIPLPSVSAVTDSVRTTTATPRESPTSSGTLRLHARVGDSLRSTVRVGGSGKDSSPTEVVAPPARFSALSLRLVVSDEASPRTRHLAAVHRRPADETEEGRTYDLRLYAEPDAPVRLTALGEEILAGQEAALIEPATGQSHDLRAGESVSIEADSTALRLAVGTAAFVEDQRRAVLPEETTLTAYPNPFRRRATFEYTLPEDADVNMAVYDVLGRRVALLEEGRKRAGRHTVVLDGTRLSSGVYIGRLRADDRIRTQKITVAR
ncbi:MAG: T9SS type A sorting domain-containing protein [Salinivenus sp.]